MSLFHRQLVHGRARGTADTLVLWREGPIKVFRAIDADRPFLRELLCALVLSLWLPVAQANPVGPQVVNGQVSIAQQGNTLSITNSPGAIINWQGFSIAGGETTRFIQQGAASSVLNRVLGPDPSVLLGTLTSNGRVFLINPAGILVGE